MTTRATSPAHTPGPWNCDPVTPEQQEHECEAYRIDGNSQFPTVASVYFREDDGETEANARLIAIAPEFYTLGKELVERDVCTCSEEEKSCLYCRFATVIAEADGTTPEANHANAA